MRSDDAVVVLCVSTYFFLCHGFLYAYDGRLLHSVPWVTVSSIVLLLLHIIIGRLRDMYWWTSPSLLKKCVFRMWSRVIMVTLSAIGVCQKQNWEHLSFNFFTFVFSLHQSTTGFPFCSRFSLLNMFVVWVLDTLFVLIYSLRENKIQHLLMQEWKLNKKEKK